MYDEGSKVRLGTARDLIKVAADTPGGPRAIDVYSELELERRWKEWVLATYPTQKD